YVDIAPTFINAAGGTPEAAIDGRSFVSVLTGETDTHKRFVFGEMTTRGINKGSPYFGIRSVRSEEYKYIVNFTPEVTFQNACTTSIIFNSWRKKALAGDNEAAEKISRYENRPAEEFYAIQEDPYEWHNLANDPNYAMQKAKLKQELLSWMEECGDKGQQTELEALEHQGRKRQSKDTVRVEKTGKL
ncbi:MAG: sulfatase atsG, partial [Planctomycetaceae bacterium]|nr:sulfatase atsG [Planctomycetaceae bacterium]